MPPANSFFKKLPLLEIGAVLKFKSHILVLVEEGAGIKMRKLRLLQ